MRTSPAELRRALKGADYPATRESLIEQARENDAPEDVVDELEEGLAEDEYESSSEVIAELGDREEDELDEDDE